MRKKCLIKLLTDRRKYPESSECPTLLQHGKISKHKHITLEMVLAQPADKQKNNFCAGNILIVNLVRFKKFYFYQAYSLKNSLLHPDSQDKRRPVYTAHFSFP